MPHAQHARDRPPLRCRRPRGTPAAPRAGLLALLTTAALSVRLQGAALALDYALGRSGLSVDKEAFVAFVDGGASGVQACVVGVCQESVRVISHAFAADAGGAVRCARGACDAAHGTARTQTRTHARKHARTRVNTHARA